MSQEWQSGPGSILALPDVIDPVLLGIFLVAAMTSFAVCALNIATERWHGRYSFDSDLEGIQKVHSRTVPRTGGIALATGVIAVPLIGSLNGGGLLAHDDSQVYFLLCLAATPAFLAGIAEDLTKKISARVRFCCIAASALLAAWMLGASLPRIGIPGLDSALVLLPVSVCLTVFAVVGVSNSINIIDGFHGVAGAAVVIILAGTGYLSWREGDLLVCRLAMAGIGAATGFLLLNYPTGRLFMGDGGAYFLGFWAAEVAVLATVRNPGINTWQILAVFAYPVIEVLFSIYRRKILKGTLAGAPDRLHLHSLFYRRCARHLVKGVSHPWRCNAAVACFVSAWMAVATVSAILFGDTAPAAVALVAIQLLAYIAAYMRLVRGHWGHCRHPAVIFGLRPQYRVQSA